MAGGRLRPRRRRRRRDVRALPGRRHALRERTELQEAAVAPEPGARHRAEDRALALGARRGRGSRVGGLVERQARHVPRFLHTGLWKPGGGDRRCGAGGARRPRRGRARVHRRRARGGCPDGGILRAQPALLDNHDGGEPAADPRAGHREDRGGQGTEAQGDEREPVPAPGVRQAQEGDVQRVRGETRRRRSRLRGVVATPRRRHPRTGGLAHRGRRVRRVWRVRGPGAHHRGPGAHRRGGGAPSADHGGGGGLVRRRRGARVADFVSEASARCLRGGRAKGDGTAGEGVSRRSSQGDVPLPVALGRLRRAG
mmetsp:Transcript_4203/g.17302  ORF Transcript_4203/g.17302 Transcript_4203/m.17302 type:complete len:312 (+) Transcript_4203:407-1342(+)